MANTQIVLLEHVDTLGKLGDVVSVKPGYARNYLLPQGKALRATKDNLAYFEAQRKQLEDLSKQKADQAANDAKGLDGIEVVLIRQASEGGQLYGSVAARDIAEVASEASKLAVGRSQVVLNTNIKTLGLFDVVIGLYGDIKATIKVNVARSQAEAEIQSKTGEALISRDEEEEVKEEAPVETAEAVEASEAVESDAETVTEEDAA